LPPSAIYKYLISEPSFLQSRTEDLPPRQRSLDAAIAWSYELLTPAQRALVRRLSVFAGGFTLAGAMEVAGDTVPDLLDGLADLVDRSLLQLEPDSSAAPDRRFHLLETARVYFLARLEEHGEREEAYRRYATYVLAVAEDEAARVRQLGYLVAPARLPLPDGSTWHSSSWLAHLDREYPNLRAALVWSEQTGNVAVELDLAIALFAYWRQRPLLADGLHWLEDAIERNPDAAPARRAHALIAAGMLLLQPGQEARAQLYLDEALGLARTADDPCLLGEVLINAATVRVGVDASQLEPATALVREALSIWRAQGDAWAVAATHFYLAWGDLLRQRGSGAIGYLREALTTFERLRDPYSAAVTWLLLSAAASLQGDGRRVTSALAEATRISRALDEPQVIAACADVAAWLIRGDDPHRAAQLLGAAGAIRESGFARTPYERVLHAQTLEELAARMHEQELELARQQGHTLMANQILDLIEGHGISAPETHTDVLSDADSRLSDRELEVIRLMSEGMSNKQIADAIFVSEGTAKLDVRSIYRKLGAHNRAQAIAIAATQGWLADGD
jgi:non-specific serine/threonine protein kinase